MEGMWAKMWDPPTESPVTPELVGPTNPVPNFVGNLLGRPPKTPFTLELELLDGLTLPAWDGVNIDFMTFGNKDIPLASGGTFPGTTIRVPRERSSTPRPRVKGRRPTPSTGTASSPPP